MRYFAPEMCGPRGDPSIPAGPRGAPWTGKFFKLVVRGSAGHGADPARLGPGRGRTLNGMRRGGRTGKDGHGADGAQIFFRRQRWTVNGQFMKLLFIFEGLWSIFFEPIECDIVLSLVLSLFTLWKLAGRPTKQR